MRRWCKREEDEDLFRPIKVPGPVSRMRWVWIVLIAHSAFWMIWSLLYRDWGAVAFHAMMIVVNALVWRAAHLSRERHREVMATFRDRQEDARSMVLNRYYQHSMSVGELRAYETTAQVFNEATLKSLGIYKSPAELEELRHA